MILMRPHMLVIFYANSKKIHLQFKLHNKYYKIWFNLFYFQLICWKYYSMNEYQLGFPWISFAFASKLFSALKSYRKVPNSYIFHDGINTAMLADNFFSWAFHSKLFHFSTSRVCSIRHDSRFNCNHLVCLR